MKTCSRSARIAAAAIGRSMWPSRCAKRSTGCCGKRSITALPFETVVEQLATLGRPVPGEVDCTATRRCAGDHRLARGSGSQMRRSRHEPQMIETVGYRLDRLRIQMAKYKFRLETLQKVREARRDRAARVAGGSVSRRASAGRKPGRAGGEADRAARRCSDRPPAGRYLDVNRLLEAQRYELLLKARGQELAKQAIAAGRGNRAAPADAGRGRPRSSRAGAARRAAPPRAQPASSSDWKRSSSTKSRPSNGDAQPGDDLMGKIIDMLFGLIAYVCVATVITLALVVGYLWHTDRLNDEKMFRMVARAAGRRPAADCRGADRSASDEVPPEEPSLNEVLHHQQVQDRNFEVKLLALQRGKQDYDASLSTAERTNRPLRSAGAGLAKPAEARRRADDAGKCRQGRQPTRAGHAGRRQGAAHAVDRRRTHGRCHSADEQDVGEQAGKDSQDVRNRRGA